jgi:hypothetical protein
LLVGSPEEASWRSNWIDDNELTTLASEFSNTNYGELLRNLPLEGK